MVRVPPPVLALLAGVAQHRLTPASRPGTSRTSAAITVALASGALASGATRRFRQDGTTIDPIHPDRASALVTEGPFSLTRNPMYVGLTGLLLANAVRRGSWLALAPAAVFVATIDRLQIAAEEAALRTKFGAEYDDYCTAVPRWLDQRSLAGLTG